MQSTLYGIAQAKARFSELTHLVDAGQDVIIAKHGKPSYRLVRANAAKPTPKPSQAKQTLADMADFLQNIRSKSNLNPMYANFVAQWRHDARY
jgi:prevent-host-death family protein